MSFGQRRRETRVRADLELTSCENPVEKGVLDLLEDLCPCMRRSSAVPGQDAANRAYKRALLEAPIG